MPFMQGDKALECPECGSKAIYFSKIFHCVRIFYQDEHEGAPAWWDYDDGDSWEADRDSIEFLCEKCRHVWREDDSIDEYTVDD